MFAVILYLFSFLRTLIFIVLLYLVIRWIRNFLATPSKNNSTSATKDGSHNKEGETTVRYNPKGEKIIDKNKGEYVDFEEVE